jgi:predicted chitinase
MRDPQTLCQARPPGNLPLLAGLAGLHRQRICNGGQAACVRAVYAIADTALLAVVGDQGMNVARLHIEARAVTPRTNGLYYQATHENPGYDPTISTWFWSPYSCTGGGGGGGTTSGFVVSEAQFNQMFPDRNSFYTYAGLTDAMRKYPAFATTGSDTVKRQEAAAFLANVGHETGGLVYINEINTANWPTYCDWSQPYGCPAGQSAYHGRGPIQLSWNFNYKAAGDALGVDLLDNPDLVATNSSISWQTGLWYWMTGTGNAGTTSHNAMVNSQGFGVTIRAINSIECNGGNPTEMQDRVNLYNQFVGLLGVPAGGNLTC